jgi:alkaline phosphatase
MESEIGRQMVRPGLLDLALGGGGVILTEDAVTSARPDVTFISTPTQLANATTLPLFGVFGDDHLEFELDRDAAQQPSLTDMATKALSLLQRGVDAGEAPGFFLLIEGSRIDMAAHANDAGAHVGEAREYNRAVEVAKAHVAAHPGVLLVAVSDHETGGLTLGRDGVYAWSPETLLQVHASLNVAAGRIAASYTPSPGATETEENDALRAVLAPLLSFPLTDVELTTIRAAIAEGYTAQALRELVNTRARIGWTSGGHTGVDIPLHVAGGEGHGLGGNMENVQVGQRLAALLGVQLPAASTAGLPVKRWEGGGGNEMVDDEYHSEFVVVDV